jgi:hypothetical protein
VENVEKKGEEKRDKKVVYKPHVENPPSKKWIHQNWCSNLAWARSLSPFAKAQTPPVGWQPIKNYKTSNIPLEAHFQDLSNDILHVLCFSKLQSQNNNELATRKMYRLAADRQLQVM